MKRRLIYLMILPLLASCSMEDDYYTNDYRRPPLPSARVDVPNQHHGHEDRNAYPQANHHQHEESSVTIRATTNHGHREDNESTVMKQYNDYNTHSHD